ncbi:hypothetical protein JVU11DRAFT_2255 [Chiua virens]|nr:hypothetical protein JVU11DRAFT_2255 [Chiua virens]
MDYFKVTVALANNMRPGVPLPLQTFASSTMAFHLALKPSFSMTITEASERFSLPDLNDAIQVCLDRCSNGEPHDLTGRRPATFDSILLMDRLQIWSKIWVQLRTWHNPESVKPPQTLVIAPPCNNILVAVMIVQSSALQPVVIGLAEV